MPPSPAILPALPIAHLAKLEAPTKAGEYTSPNKASRRLHKMWPKKNITQKRTQFHSFIKPTHFSRLQDISRCLTSPDFSSHDPRLASVASSRPRQRGHFASEAKKKAPPTSSLLQMLSSCPRCQKKTQFDCSICFSKQKHQHYGQRIKFGPLSLIQVTSCVGCSWARNSLRGAFLLWYCRTFDGPAWVVVTGVGMNTLILIDEK